MIVCIILVFAAGVSTMGTSPRSDAYGKLDVNKLAEHLKWFAADISLRLELGNSVNEGAMRASVIDAAGYDYALAPEMKGFVSQELKVRMAALKRIYSNRSK